MGYHQTSILGPYENNANTSLCYAQPQQSLLQRSWIIIFACAVILLPVYLFTRAPARGARPGPADLRRRRHHLALVHPRHVLLRLVLHAPDVPAGAEQEHDQLIITYLAMLNLGLHLALSWLMTVRFRLGLAGLMGSMVIAM